ncbi:MAG: N-formylglutamate amidohydrolase [Fibrobacter sp.]|nr:N-formylglutamate amidohydrolase [Fibrobacter sp.]
MRKKSALLVTCEHGGNTIPLKYRYLFNNTDILTTHRGYDPGALPLAKKIAAYNNCNFLYETISRLLIEQNRSIGHASLFSRYSQLLSPDERELLLVRYYHPYHQKILSLVQDNLSTKRFTIHLSIHTFTPVLDGVERTADVGILYDPSSDSEYRTADWLKKNIREQINGIRVRRNYPYKGVSDGLTAWLRKKYNNMVYCGIEIEINQKHYQEKTAIWKQLSVHLPRIISELHNF